MKRWVNVSILAITLTILPFLPGCPGNDNYAARVTISNLSFSSDSKISIILSKNPYILLSDFSVEARGEGFSEKGSVTIQLLRIDDETPWQPSGSWYVLLRNEDGRDAYISKNPINFNSNPQTVLNFSQFKIVAFAFLIDELFDRASKIIGSSSITLDELVYIVTNGDYNYSDTIDETNYRYFKDPDFTQPFKGDSIVDVNTIFFTPTFPFGEGSDG